MNIDIKIWNDFKKGENCVLSHIYCQHVQLLFRYGKKFSKNNEIIKDTIQDLFFDLIRTRENLGKTDNIRFYLITSFKRKLVKNLRKQILFVDGGMGKNIEAEIVYSVEHDLICKEELTHREKIVQKALRELSPKQREILFYRFTCDFEYEQICQIMSLKYDSARKLVFRALKSLKKCLVSSDIFLLFFGFFPKNFSSQKK
ncbi:MAG: sigma-70 family RNA polymerase sigma factor [Prolixibacteraceae bacterium]|jgi:RNA polymerase sigma factor (sigma-70 family)|nr:sigma-70 family RNA polymerase sigma factor [Prolixibacteraceae bacterium]MBT6007570.1 sigma-70 family RNA polymerase sigma factor [Prolixibacteraceae bacterium]MBT6763236.1 sigma-70 family RNA polymerase sigma factor [Prolixibacteraceae bacterium]MBT6998564.1 sigma-70 family RNA polymerase sigma factor [Prolixibacteraceae bacterium]MBT7395722.1 sigma-70 family RNA polymerase sigma factor [Prolixibacteraceae bacterium]